TGLYLGQLSSLLAPYTKSEFVLLGDINWDLLKPPDQADWLSFRQMRNKCTQAIRKAKVSYFKEQFSLSGSNPKKFWKTVKDLENKPSSSQLPMSLNVDDVVTDKGHMAELFNHYFIKSGFLFDSAMPHCPSNISSSPTPSNATSPDAPPSFPPAPLQNVLLPAVTES
ncbi:unnamed protein product, partial [Coregonus sp. 'balchen']